MAKNNSITLYGKVTTEPTYRSTDKNGSDLYTFLITTENKTIKSGTVKVVGESVLCCVYEKKNEFNVKNGDLVKITGTVLQDHIDNYSSLCAFVEDIDFVKDIKLEDINTLQVTGTIYKNPPLLRELKNGSERVTFLIENKISPEDKFSMKLYTLAWNNLAHKIQELNFEVGDTVAVEGTLISHKVTDPNTGNSYNLGEILARRVERA